MRNLLTFLVLNFTFLAQNSLGQIQNKFANGNYNIDEKAEFVIVKKLNLIPESPTSCVDFAQYYNDTLNIDTRLYNMPLPIATTALKNKDTVKIIALLGNMDGGFRYQIILYKDTCIVTCFIGADQTGFKNKKTDTPSSEILLQCKNYNFTLARKPQYLVGEIITGFIDLVTDDYYIVVKGSKETKCKMHLTGYFKTKLSEIDKENKLWR